MPASNSQALLREHDKKLWVVDPLRSYLDASADKHAAQPKAGFQAKLKDLACDHLRAPTCPLEIWRQLLPRVQ